MDYKDSKKEIVQTIIRMSGKYSPDIIFSDWVQCSAIAIQNSCYLVHDAVWKSREEQYINIMNRYTPEERKEFVRMLMLLTDAFEEKMSDILGEIYMESGCGSKHTGQFFTPFHTSVLTAEMALEGKMVSEDEKYELIRKKEAIEIVNELAEEYNQGHFGCNTNGEHEKCTGCGVAPECRIAYKYWFGAKDNENGWISCSKRLPKVETEVLIYARRKYTGGHFKDIITTAMYEDGTIRENDSCWVWQDIEGEWDKEEECYIIPEGWWEYRHYNPDEVYNNTVDDEVIAWQPLPEPYQQEGE